jgi:urease accessory protein
VTPSLPEPADLALVRLLQLCSGSLPIGGFGYSQGLEWAVATGWIQDQASLGAWLGDLAATNLPYLEIPLLARLHGAVVAGDLPALDHWCQWLLASRETRELRDEERQRGRALATLLVDLELPRARAWRSSLATSQSAGFALATVAWGIPLPQAALGFAWAWLENMILAGVKLIPLGQTAGQRLLHDLGPGLVTAVRRGLTLKDDDLGASAPALAIASSRHPHQYCRLFRS